MTNVMAGLDSSSAAEIFEAIFTPAGRANPYPLYAALQELGDVAVLEPGQILAFSYAAVNATLREPAFQVKDASYLDRVWPAWREHPAMLQHSLLTSNAPEHGRMRSLVAGTFTPRRIAQLRPAIGRIAEGLVAGMREQGAGGAAVDFMAAFAYQLPVTVICELLGVPEPDRETFRPMARDLARGIDFDGDGELIVKADAAALWMHDYFGRLAADRRATPRDDLIGALVQAADSGAEAGDSTWLSPEELLGNLTLLLFAGFETTTNLLGNGLRIMLTRPDVESALRSGAIQAAEFVTEVLRYDSPVQAGTDRWCPADTELCGIELPAGSQVIGLIGAANRDPRRFTDPDTFDPRRTDAGALSFGAGPHYCLGASLARLEGEVAFPLLLDSFPALAAAGEPARRGGVALRGFDRMPVTIR
jgi:cytochrome P450